jgi:hypothetical protein
MYADIGRSIAAAGFDSVSRRAYTSTARKIFLAGKSLIALRSTRYNEQSEPPLQEAVPLLAAVSPMPIREPKRRIRLRPTLYMNPGRLQQETGP